MKMHPIDTYLYFHCQTHSHHHFRGSSFSAHLREQPQKEESNKGHVANL